MARPGPPAPTAARSGLGPPPARGVAHHPSRAETTAGAERRGGHRLISGQPRRGRGEPSRARGTGARAAARWTTGGVASGRARSGMAARLQGGMMTTGVVEIWIVGGGATSGTAAVTHAGTTGARAIAGGLTRPAGGRNPTGGIAMEVAGGMVVREIGMEEKRGGAGVGVGARRGGGSGRWRTRGGGSIERPRGDTPSVTCACLMIIDSALHASIHLAWLACAWTTAVERARCEACGALRRSGSHARVRQRPGRLKTGPRSASLGRATRVCGCDCLSRLSHRMHR